MPQGLRAADLLLAPTADGTQVTSRFGHLSEQDARMACSLLQSGSIPCVVVPPGRPMVVATK